ncbi:hypothetical protein OS493_038353 [Desmophyllum pertusum]|uniref:Uncharacterized protein n=1 Tax=Desmophyllum pertusum TaxID=174260 RepID=A0A9W9Y8H7_9CNID|nr:hypothetical protein OS493_038353 [Desmophyllum pertusum]
MSDRVALSLPTSNVQTRACRSNSFNPPPPITSGHRSRRTLSLPSREKPMIPPPISETPEHGSELAGEQQAEKQQQVCLAGNCNYEIRKPVRSRIKFKSLLAYSRQFDLGEPGDVMYDSHFLTPPHERPRSTRSHSLKSTSQPNLLTHRKRLYSLPSKPVIPPYIIIQGCRDNKESHSDEEESSCEWSNESMAWYTPVVGLSCSLVMYFWSCALAYYSAT